MLHWQRWALRGSVGEVVILWLRCSNSNGMEEHGKVFKFNKIVFVL